GAEGEDVLLTFSDAGAPFGVEPFTCDCLMQPAGPGALGDLIGEPSLGLWTLSITDFLAGDEGTVDAWCVRIDGCEAAPPTDLVCTAESGDVTLEWVNGEAYDEIEIRVGDALLEVIGGAETSFVDTGVEAGIHHYRVVGTSLALACGSSTPACTVAVGIIETCDGGIVTEPDDFAYFSLDVADGVNIAKTEMVLDMSVEYPDEWTVRLSSPEGTTVQLHDEGGFDAESFDVVWGDEGIPNGEPYACGGCLMQPSGPGTMADYTGEISQGDWVFELGGFSLAVINEWCVRVWAECDLPLPEDVECAVSGAFVTLTWVNGRAYDTLAVLRDGLEVARLAGDAESWIDGPLANGIYEYRIAATSVALGCTSTSRACEGGVGLTELCEEPAADIGDLLDPVEREVEMSDDLVLEMVQVRVDITHTWIGDLEVHIASPLGVEVRLHDHQGDESNDLHVTYADGGVANDGATPYTCRCTMQPSGPGSLADLVPGSPAGIWTLTVADTAVGDDGSLDAWCLRLLEASPQGPAFIRGDADGNGTVSFLLDALFVLLYQFVSGSDVPPCLEAADVDGNAEFSGLLDALYQLSAGFIGGAPPPPSPYPECGSVVALALGCETGLDCP
ncbi:MAG: proprotein convertase P-domain-containing protein, partial [Actinobacteria bacterium]|nr:proprotein convertase P-domain-containing protein [Actinomycetota bacterium]